MDFTVTLAAVGILITLILGILSIWLTVKRKYLGRITFVCEDVMGLYDDIMRYIPELSISYNNVPVTENSVVLKGFFVNTGAKDISPDMVEERLTIRLSEGNKWVLGRVVSCSPSVRASVAVLDNRNLVFDMGLFRRDEYIRFEALAEMSTQSPVSPVNGGKITSGERLVNTFEFHHRISDTDKIRQVHLPSIEEGPSPISEVFSGHMFIPVFLTFLILVMVANLGAIVFRQWTTLGLRYIIQTDSGKRIEADMYPRSKDKIAIEGTKEDYYKELTPDQFTAMWKGQIAIVRPRVVLKQIMLPLVATSLPALLFAIILYIQRRRTKKIRELLLSSRFDARGLLLRSV